MLFFSLFSLLFIRVVRCRNLPSTRISCTTPTKQKKLLYWICFVFYSAPKEPLCLLGHIESCHPYNMYTKYIACISVRPPERRFNNNSIFVCHFEMFISKVVFNIVLVVFIFIHRMLRELNNTIIRMFNKF